MQTSKNASSPHTKGQQAGNQHNQTDIPSPLHPTSTCTEEPNSQCLLGASALSNVKPLAHCLYQYCHCHCHQITCLQSTITSAYICIIVLLTLSTPAVASHAAAPVDLLLACREGRESLATPAGTVLGCAAFPLPFCPSWCRASRSLFSGGLKGQKWPEGCSGHRTCPDAPSATAPLLRLHLSACISHSEEGA